MAQNFSIHYKAGHGSLLKHAVFWDVVPCTLTEVYHHFGERTASIFRECQQTSKINPYSLVDVYGYCGGTTASIFKVDK